MCGIGVTVGVTLGPEEGAQLENVLKRRGPDYAHVVQLSPTLCVQATVLHMRGPSLAPQPVSLQNSVFCWNGEIYEMDGEEEEDINSASDTYILSAMLGETMQEGCATLQGITAVMSRVSNGEFAFCVVDETNVFYGRDWFGRRSLLVSESDDTWRLSSVATGSLGKTWTEVPPGRVYQYNLVTGKTDSLPLIQPTTFGNVPPPCTTSMERPSNVSQSMWRASLQLQELLVRAVQRRCCCSSCREGVGILFSGGLDSVVLTALAAQLLPRIPLDLLNVSFDDNSADRQAALQSHAELQALYPSHIFRLVCIQVDWDRVVEQQERIETLMHPNTTTMDLNIATALWFAAGGKGTLLDDHQPYHSTCRILLLGMGADEQMAGYGRHRKCCCVQDDGGYSRLRQELDMDLGRLWKRNLGRDDRLVSDHGKEARFPYLDTHVVNFLSSISLQDVCDFSQEPGIGDKQILRLIAQRLGLTTASGLVKRAIQFGSRIAHVSDKRRFGSRRKATGESHYKASAKTPR